MAIEARFAEAGDVDWIIEHERLTRALVVQKVARSEYVVAVAGQELIGLLRLSFFWSWIPMIDRIWVDERRRGDGAGRAMLAVVESLACARAIPFVLSSSQADEPEPQRWHRHMGFEHVGTIDGLAPLQNVPEIVLLKRVASEEES